MKTIATMCGIIIAVVVGITLLFYSLWRFRHPRQRNSCPMCGGDLIQVDYGRKCPACNMLIEDPHNNGKFIS